MNDLTHCPWCGTHVLLTGGKVCPACRGDVSKWDPEQALDDLAVADAGDAGDTSDRKRLERRQEAYRLIDRCFNAKKSRAAIIQELEANGFSRNLTQWLFSDYEQMYVDGWRRKASRGVAIGGCLVVGGLLMSIGSYARAAQFGGPYYVYHGAVLWGAIKLWTSFVHQRRLSWSFDA